MAKNEDLDLIYRRQCRIYTLACVTSSNTITQIQYKSRISVNVLCDFDGFFEKRFYTRIQRKRKRKTTVIQTSFFTGVLSSQLRRGG